MKSWLPFLLCVVMTFSLPLSSASGDDSGQSAQTLDTTVAVQMDYLLALPQDYESRSEWPLVLFLHGAGERGDDLEKVKKHGPPKLVAAGKSFPFILVSPQCREGVWWEPIRLTALLDEIEKNYKVDTSRIYVTGLSMGGFGTWRLAAYTPERFAAIAPICGGGEPFWAGKIHHIPTWVFHGAQDKAVPVERSEEMVEALEKQGGEPKLTIYPEAGHDSWTATYDNPGFYDWLLEQQLEAEQE
jgi:predicted peptidase